MEQHGKGKQLIMGLKNFQCQVATSLTKAGKQIQRKRGRSSSDVSTPPAKKRGPAAARPVADIQYDGMEHWPLHSDNKVRCKYCPKGWTRIICSKCSVGLCLNKHNNCFLKFHTK